MIRWLGYGAVAALGFVLACEAIVRGSSLFDDIDWEHA